MAAAVQAREATPPPVIGKAGRYTVFITPPATPKPQISSPSSVSSPSPRMADLPVKAPPSPPLPVQVPPRQFDKPAATPRGAGSTFGFFWNAVAKVQEVHSSLDEYLADWFGLNQSKYQWALNDYYESKGLDKESVKQTELATKGEVV
ncbi:hypothetical protein J5N97_026771 [Dioscorea zingiberensis]|uniref:Uncharacterized protein n=1 Tax=Dioscorea zingiberensis TaxID=325984 RepID=A0A9D5C3L9_9LILI|nr:hypothetical protein J5N97_026771 [Dioscorea zingiberensis]